MNLGIGETGEQVSRLNIGRNGGMAKNTHPPGTIA